MDPETLDAYNRDAAAFAEAWDAQPVPLDVLALVRRFFTPGRTADIGCGSGRDTAWLEREGFTAIGYDAAEGILAEARRLRPHIPFQQASLPDLAGIDDNSFTNVFCETVIMHLPRTAIDASVRRLLSIVEPHGTLYLSWPVSHAIDRRDERGRLYTAFDPALVLHALGEADILLNEKVISASSRNTVRRVVARKHAAVA